MIWDTQSDHTTACTHGSVRTNVAVDSPFHGWWVTRHGWRVTFKLAVPMDIWHTKEFARRYGSVERPCAPACEVENQLEVWPAVGEITDLRGWVSWWLARFGGCRQRKERMEVCRWPCEPHKWRPVQRTWQLAILHVWRGTKQIIMVPATSSLGGDCSGSCGQQRCPRSTSGEERRSHTIGPESTTSCGKEQPSNSR